MHCTTPMRTSIRPGPAGDQRVKRTKVLQFNLCSPSSERHFLFASDWLSVASVAAWISTLADGVLLFPALGARISVAHAPALVVPSHASKIGSPCDSFGCYHGWAVSQDYRKRGIRGFDAHKRIRGRKRHILVDTLGIPIASRVEAANMSDRRAAARLLGGLGQSFRRSKRSSRMPVTKAASSQGSSKPRATSFESLNAVSGRSRVVGLTWIVERTFAWIGRYRRMSKDYEHRVQTSETLIDLIAIRLMLNRLTKS
jgi:transposase